MQPAGAKKKKRNKSCLICQTTISSELSDHVSNNALHLKHLKSDDYLYREIDALINESKFLKEQEL